MTHMRCEPSKNKFIRTLYFRFDSSFSATILHSLPPSYRSIMGNLKVESENEVHLENITDYFSATNIKYFQLSLPSETAPLSITIKDVNAVNLSYVYCV